MKTTLIQKTAPWFIAAAVGVLLSGCVNPQTGLPVWQNGWGSGEIFKSLEGDVAHNCDLQGSIPGSLHFHCTPH